ncbi:hypothetical protein ACQJBY_015516 [Aegilops geniculata]
MEEEAVRRDEVRAARALLGVQAAARHRPHHQAHPPRQGTPSRLQGQAGVCGLPDPCETWWQEAPSAQGYCLWQA